MLRMRRREWLGLHPLFRKGPPSGGDICIWGTVQGNGEEVCGQGEYNCGDDADDPPQSFQYAVRWIVRRLAARENPRADDSRNGYSYPYHRRCRCCGMQCHYCRSGRCQGESVSPQEHVRASIYLHSGPGVVDGRSDDVDASLLVEFRCVVSHTVANLLCFYGLRKIFPVSGVVKVSCRAQESPRARQTRRDGVSRRRCARRRMSRTICCPRSCRTCCGHRSRVCGHPSSV